MMTTTRILACAFTCSPPGTSGFTGGESLLGWNLINQIARFHEVWVLTQPEDRKTLEQALKENGITNIHFCYVSMPLFLRPLLRLQGGHQIYYYLWQVKAYFVARKLHKQHRFDLFHHVTYANDWMASFIGALLPVSYIRGPCGGAQRTPKNFLGQYNLKGRLWELLRSVGQWLFRHDPFFVLGQSRSTTILACNPEVLNALPDKWRNKAHLFSVNGVSSTDLSLYSPETRTGETFRILSAGKLIRLKGFQLCIRTFSAFAEKYPDSELIIVGDGPDSQYLAEEARVSGLEEKIRFERWMPREELMKIMGSSDVFLFSGLRDGGGAVVVEAMSMGLPVVCLDIGGPALHVTDEIGIKVPASTPECSVQIMASALERLYLDREMRERMGAAARSRAMQTYHWDRAGERLSEFYQQAFPTETTT